MRYIYFFLIFFLTSCIEIIDDLKINLDGSGTFKYTINLSTSKTKVTSILVLDSLYGEKVPKITDIKEKIKLFKETLKEQEGISNVIITEDYVNYIIKFQCDFKNVENLENALKMSINKTSEKENYNWLSFKDKILIRKIPIINLKEIESFGGRDIDKLKTGNYTSITRFASKIDTFENKNSVRSKSNTAIMVKVSPDMLLINQNLLDNKIILKKYE